MGFFFRKSIGFGPFRVNFSRSGIGVSGGIRGARLSVGPRGTYVHAGRGGFYYKQKLRSTQADPAGSHQQSQEETVEHVVSVDVPPGKVAETIQPLPKHWAPMLIRAVYLSIIAVVVTWVYIYGVDRLPNSIEGRSKAGWMLVTIPTALWIAGVCIHVIATRVTFRPRLYPLYYQLDEASISRFSGINSAFKALAASARLSTISSAQSHTMLSQGQGVVTVTRQQPWNIVTNVEPWCVAIGGWRMFFLPDNIYILDKGTYSTLPYEALKLSRSQRRAFEYNSVPADATIVDRTWAHTRKDGLPDRRYNYNPMIPIVLYGLITLESNAGWSLVIQTSKLESAEDFLKAILLAVPGLGGHRSRTRQQSESKQRSDDKKSHQKTNASTPKVSPVGAKSAYEVLQVSQNATLEEITTAYRKQATMNHPDRVANLAPEFRDLAERKMKEINAAYEELKKKSI